MMRSYPVNVLLIFGAIFFGAIVDASATSRTRGDFVRVGEQIYFTELANSTSPVFRVWWHANRVPFVCYANEHANCPKYFVRFERMEESPSPLIVDVTVEGVPLTDVPGDYLKLFGKR